MSTSITVRRYLDKQDVPYSVVSCPVDTEGHQKSDNLGDISASCVTRAIILKDVSGSVMAVIPVTHSLNLDALNRQLHRKLIAADVEDYESVFSDCKPGVLPSLGEAYGFETVIDDSLLDQDFVYVSSGNDGELIRMTGQDFRTLHSNAWYGNVFFKYHSIQNNVFNCLRQRNQVNCRKTQLPGRLLATKVHLQLPVCVSALSDSPICRACHRWHKKLCS